ncbi:HEAT repeat domain-containing protein [Nostoc sp. UCD121]|uniref:HEAT repeat domain-containing protein n=1 Tax=unclassified Nostoc TaxID=2593658 RepID=UPI001626B20D|nr:MULTISPECIES: HEAT repeat domain-containing protein [unclassified Nostoc]MBC1224052.1 HEAT repeat domain-containing protein [Nostoc sp. UCD120]MBC1276084.1 HEAT repeat domain-containing protein [Nostoc sp. UCD121]MBC1294653.1 HEAT repeat domain-containing protein [Nostoc sp. UCD122]
MNNSDLAQILIRAVQEADSSERLVDAVQELAAADIEESVPTLIAALGYNNPGAAVAAVDGLIAIGEAAVSPLLELIDDYNYGARAWALRALAGIGDVRALDTLLEAAKTDFSLSVRRAAARGLGTLRWHQVPPEKVESVQTEVLEALLLISQDPEWVVRYAAVTSLETLAIAIAVTLPDQASRITNQLQQMLDTDADLGVRTRAKFAQEKIQPQQHQEVFAPKRKLQDTEVEVPHRGGGRR